MADEVAVAERARIVALLETAIERYDEKQLRQYLEGLVAFQREGGRLTANGA